MSDDIAKAKELLNQRLAERIEHCRARIEQVLQEENCFIDVAMVISTAGHTAADKHQSQTGELRWLIKSKKSINRLLRP